MHLAPQAAKLRSTDQDEFAARVDDLAQLMEKVREEVFDAIMMTHQAAWAQANIEYFTAVRETHVKTIEAFDMLVEMGHTEKAQPPVIRGRAEQPCVRHRWTSSRRHFPTRGAMGFLLVRR
jgi:hypothetical protein